MPDAESAHRHAVPSTTTSQPTPASTTENSNAPFFVTAEASQSRHRSSYAEHLASPGGSPRVEDHGWLRSRSSQLLFPSSAALHDHRAYPPHAAAVGGPLTNSRRSVVFPRRRQSRSVPVAPLSGNLAANSSSSVYSVILDGDDGGVEVALARPHMQAAADLRPRYKNIDKGQQEPLGERLAYSVLLQNDAGVYLCAGLHTVPTPWETYYDDITTVTQCVQHPSCHTACRYRLQVLEEKYSMYTLCNTEIESSIDRYRRGCGIFGTCRKVDNFVAIEHLMGPRELMGRIRETFENRGDDIVLLVGENKEPQSLRRVCEILEFPDPSLLTADGLGLQPGSVSPITSYDPTNPALNQGSRNSAALLRLFLSRNTHNGGEYLAEAVRPCLQRNVSDSRRCEATECHFEITGLTSDEWSVAARWALERHLLKGYETNRWIAAFPRRLMHPPEIVGDHSHVSLWDPELKSGPGGHDADQVESPRARRQAMLQLEHHQQHLDNLFLPLFMATIAPEDPNNSAVADLLNHMGGIVVIPDESDHTSVFERRRRRPADVPWSEPVSDLYFCYYVWANICSLNALRRCRGLNTLQFRVVAGSMSSSGTTHLDALILSYLLSDMVINGLNLAQHPVLQFLYGLHGIGICMSPMTANALGTVDYAAHPFPQLFRRGLRVTLCTTSPLMYHHTDDALLEEYAAACRMFRLSAVDMCEVALNSVLMSSFPQDGVKEHWVGEAMLREGWRGNQYDLTNVPAARLELRHNMWRAEQDVMMVRLPAEQDGGTELPSVSFSSPQLSSPAANPLNSTAASDNVSPDPQVDFTRVRVVGPVDRSIQLALSAQRLMRAMELRNGYLRRGWVSHSTKTSVASSAGGGGSATAAGVGAGEHPLMRQELMPTKNIEQAFRRDSTDAFDEDEWKFKTVEGVVVPHEVHQIPRLPQDMSHYEDFRSHVQEVRGIVEDANVRNFSLRRLQLLENRFKLHVAVNHSREAGSTAAKASSNRDFYQATKVDNAVRMEAGMTARLLLDFIINKARNSGDDIVSHQEGKEPQTLRQLLQELNISADSLTVDDLNVQVDTNRIGGVQDEDAQFVPEGRDELLTLLLKTDNEMQGRYFAEMIKLTFENLERDRFTFTENRLPIYGSSNQEWSMLSSWFDTHGMASSHNSWMVQVPRIYGYLRRQGKVRSFAEYLENIFTPLWLVSLHPNKDPRLFHFVTNISGFDTVADEQRNDIPLHMATRAPHDWTSEEDPPYNYYLYHIWANIYSLNAFRRRRNFSQFSFRPSCGESGSLDHLIGGFLLSNSVTYGVQLAKGAGLQYLFYLAQIGVTMCPLSNNSRVQGYLENPFPQFFRRGLLVSLGTDNPLKYHHTQEPLLEEYSIASKVWKLSANDMCELARNSVLLSGFSPIFKKQRLGDLFYLSSSRSNDASRTHLSDIRVAYRFETFHVEMAHLENLSGQYMGRALLNLREEQREMGFLRGEELHKENIAVGGMIDADRDEGDLEQLQSQRARLRKELEDLSETVEGLQRHNKHLTEKLQEERERDQLAAQMRRQKLDAREVDEQLGRLKQILLPPSLGAAPPEDEGETVDVRLNPQTSMLRLTHADGRTNSVSDSSMKSSSTADARRGVTLAAPRTGGGLGLGLLSHPESLWSSRLAEGGDATADSSQQPGLLAQLPPLTRNYDHATSRRAA